MNSSNLTTEQALALAQKLAPMVGYLSRLSKRMVAKRFPPDDRLAQAVGRAQAAMQDLFVEAHYLSCGDVTMRPEVVGPDTEQLWSALYYLGTEEPGSADAQAVAKLVELGLAERGGRLTPRGEEAFVVMESGDGEVAELQPVE